MARDERKKKSSWYEWTFTVLWIAFFVVFVKLHVVQRIGFVPAIVLIIVLYIGFRYLLTKLFKPN